MLAVPNMDKFAILIREQRKLYQREEEVVKEVTKEDDDARLQEERLKQYQTAAKRLDNAVLVLRRFISIGNELRTPVTKEEIVSEVARQLNINIQPDNLHLQSPLASLGEFELPLRLPQDSAVIGEISFTAQTIVAFRSRDLWDWFSDQMFC
ncbi:unnamed protein product [Urochloa humidicola]